MVCVFVTRSLPANSGSLHYALQWQHSWLYAFLMTWRVIFGSAPSGPDGGRSEIVREALRAFLHAAGRPPSRPADRVRQLLGSLESGILDLARNHRRYVLESLTRAR